MPFISKPSNRQTGTPSPTPGDFLNTLLIVKDTVNATLLTEHTRLADLSNVLSDVEDQIRVAVELTIKNVKTEYEKRKRKTVPGIKRLHDSLKSLSKSESKCKASERYCKNADAKKAKRRIKDAKKILQEFISSDIEFGVSTFVADQITLLCQQLMQIPPKLSSRETKDESNEVQQTEKSDSDSEGSSRVNTPTSHIYTEIDVVQARNSTYLTPRRSTCLFPSERDDKTDTSDRGSPVPRLNSVVLFSSDSDDDYGFGNTKTETKHPKSVSNGKRKSRSNKKTSRPKSKSPDYEILNRPTKNDLFKRSNSADKSPSRSRKSSIIMSSSPVVNDEYEKPVKREIESLSAPIKEYMKRMSPSCEIESNTENKEIDDLTEDLSAVRHKQATMYHTTDETLSPSISRINHKRLLPAIPNRIIEGRNKEYMCLRTHHAHCNPHSADQTDGELQECIDQPDGVLQEYIDRSDGELHEEIVAQDGELLESINNPDNLSTANNTVELLIAAQDLLNKCNFTGAYGHKEFKVSKRTLEDSNGTHEVGTQSVPLENDYIDVEEIKFRETVRSARREIIDKLKSKYVYNCNSSAVLDKSDPNTFSATSALNADLYKHNSSSTDESKTASKESLSIHGNHGSLIVHTDKSNSTTLVNENINKTVSNRHIDYAKRHQSGVYKSKLIYTYGTQNKTNCSTDNETPSHSFVTSAIKMFENAHSNGEQNNKARKQHPVVKYEHGARYRSVSEPRTVMSTRTGNSKTSIPDRTKSNKALQPRTCVQHKSSNDIDNSQSNDENPLSLSKSCTENDLLNLVKNETSSSIRKQWRERRSSSMTPRVQDISKTLRPVYEYWCSFNIPAQTTRCFISAIVVLEDRSIVLLDELHSYLHLFDRTFKHKDQYRLLDMPRGCVQVNADTIAVAFPYKKCICTYCVKMGAILSGNETTVPCREWIIDLAYSNNLLYVLCKAGEVHVLTTNGSENSCIKVGIGRTLFIPPTGKRLFILGEGRVSKFDTNGTFISSKADIDAHSMIFLENKIYVADRQRHNLVPLSDCVEGYNLIDIKIKYPTAVSSSVTGDTLLISQFEESMDLALTSKVNVLKLQRK